MSAREPYSAEDSQKPEERPNNGSTSLRDVFDLKQGEKLKYREIGREKLNGGTMTGPVVVTEAQTTTLVRPGWNIQQSKHGHLILERQ